MNMNCVYVKFQCSYFLQKLIRVTLALSSENFKLFPANGKQNRYQFPVHCKPSHTAGTAVVLEIELYNETTCQYVSGDAHRVLLDRGDSDDGTDFINASFLAVSHLTLVCM